jgi:hypothetical protein
MGRGPKVGTRPNEFKYGMALYGAAWPEGDFYFVCGGGGHGLQNRCVTELQEAPAPAPCRFGGGGKGSCRDNCSWL